MKALSDNLSTVDVDPSAALGAAFYPSTPALEPSDAAWRKGRLLRSLCPRHKGDPRAAHWAGTQSVSWDRMTVQSFDLTLIATKHSWVITRNWPIGLPGS
jgi:hypothetical protein